MFDRLMSAALLLGVAALAIFLFQRHYAAPFCDADQVTAAVVQQVSGAMGGTGLDVTRVASTKGGLFARVRHCTMAVGPLIGLQRVAKVQWTQVTYTAARDAKSGMVTVVARLAGTDAAQVAGR